MGNFLSIPVGFVFVFLSPELTEEMRLINKTITSLTKWSWNTNSPPQYCSLHISKINYWWWNNKNKQLIFIHTCMITTGMKVPVCQSKCVSPEWRAAAAGRQSLSQHIVQQTWDSDSIVPQSCYQPDECSKSQTAPARSTDESHDTGKIIYI